MKNSKELFRDLLAAIKLPEDNEEIESMAYQVVEYIANLDQTAVLAEKKISWSNENQRQLERIVERINEYEPLQYILGEAEFFGRKFKVNPAVLIPRPETEELTEEVLDQHAKLFSADKKVSILDIGAGSGCIPITLKLEISNTDVFATDISEEALRVAEENAKHLKAEVKFIKHNILEDALPFNDLDIIISNPPYIPVKEKSSMKKNVVEYEPEVALFVPDDDVLIFYRAIAGKGMDALNNEGLLIVEVNERYGKEVSSLFSASGFSDVTIIKDLSGKDRIVTARRFF